MHTFTVGVDVREGFAMEVGVGDISEMYVSKQKRGGEIEKLYLEVLRNSFRGILEHIIESVEKQGGLKCTERRLSGDDKTKKSKKQSGAAR